ncbi:MAG: Gfo/Idh/MocA family oxidoreductase [Pseudomonadota bacterium]
MEKFSKQSINWGIWGTGGIATKFAEDLKAVTDAKLHSVCSRRKDASVSFAEKFRAARSYADHQAFLQDPELDAVYIATPNVLHRQQAEVAMQHGKAVLIEKPVAMTASDARAIDQASRSFKVFAMEALWTRFLPAVQKARSLLKSGELGKPVRAETTLQFVRPFDPNHRLFDPKLGGGVMHDLGVYPLSIAQFLFGPIQVQNAFWSKAPTGVDQTARFEVLAGSTHVQAAVGFWEPSDGEGDNGFAVFCERGALRIDRPFIAAPSLSIWRSPQSSLPQITGNKLQRGIAKLRNRPDEVVSVHSETTGLNFEVEAVHAAMRAGLRQNEDNSLEESARVLDAIEEILAREASDEPLR